MYKDIKILAITTERKVWKMMERNNEPSHSKWGLIELSRCIKEMKIITEGNIISNTITFLKEDFDVLFMHNCNPIRFLPLHLIKKIIPSTKGKRIICLCHASVYGKSRKPSHWSWFGRAISWMLKGYDLFLFFSRKSLDESVIAGICDEKCRIIHWGADLDFLKTYIGDTASQGYWLSSGREKRDTITMELAAQMLKGISELKIIKGGLQYKDVLKLTAHCKGVIVIPKKNALNYCTGLTCIVEAFALGKPIVAVRNLYYPFDIEREMCGLYVDPASPRQIAEAIQRIESDSALYQTMCRNSIRLSHKYNMYNYSDELLEVL